MLIQHRGRKLLYQYELSIIITLLSLEYFKNLRLLNLLNKNIYSLFIAPIKLNKY